MRCVDCEPEPLTPGHFCECCGRKLSVAERTTLEANPAPAPPVVEASPRTASALRELWRTIERRTALRIVPVDIPVGDRQFDISAIDAGDRAPRRAIRT